MDIIKQNNILYNDCFTYLYQDQLNEQKRIEKEKLDTKERDDLLKNILDEQEKWIIDNCTPLFFIEKASNILQEYVRGVNVEKLMIQMVDFYKDNGINIFETSEDGKNALRIINLKKIEFLTDNKLIKDDTYIRNINDIVSSILGKRDKKECLIVDFETEQEIVFAITLSFGEYGGHYGLVFCKYVNSKWNVCLIDPYTKTYVDIFKEIIKDIIDLMTDRLNSESFGFGTFMKTMELKIGSGIQELSYVETAAPKKDLEKYNVQTTNNQDHFCFMWCIYFFEKFLLCRWRDGDDYYKCIEKIINNITEISLKTFSEKLIIIKEYIIDFVNEKQIIELKGSTKTFFDNYFPCIWDDPNITSDKIIKNFKLYKLIKNNIDSFEIKEVDEKDNYFLYRPFIIDGLDKYEFRTSESLKIFSTLSSDLITKFDVKDSDNIVKLFYYKLFSIVKSLGIKVKNITIPYNYYDEKESSFGEKYFIKGNLINPDLSLSKECKDKEARDIGKLLTLKDFSCNYNEYSKRRVCENPKIVDTCKDLGNRITNRNEVFKETKFRCKLTDIIELGTYQESVYKIMDEKIIKSGEGESRSENPGLLVWFGTGTGKTFAASVVAKMSGFCMNFKVIRKVIIISPKSAFTNFKKELEGKLNIMMNKFLKQDDLSKSKIEDSFYFHGKNTNIFLFTHPIFEDLFMNDLGYVNDNDINYYNKKFLEDALLIVDECHNYIGYDNNGPKKKTSFMLDCCKTVKQVLLLTATPIVNTPFDLEILLSFLDGRDIGNKKDFTKEYFGKFNDTPFFEINKGDNIVINEDQLSLTKTFDTDQNWGIENNKIGKVPCKNDISIEIKVTPTKKPDEIKKYFSDRIIYYMVEDKSEYKSEDKSEFPKYNEKIYYIFWNTENDYNTYINKYLKNIKLIKKNREKEETNAFNAGENAYIWKTNIMLNSILNVIKTRESLSPELEIDEVKTDLEIDLKYKFNTTSYKYIIFCIFQDNIKLLYNFLSTYIEKTKIGIIRGDTSAEDRKKTADDYDKGNIKIIILSKAGEEGVDFKRTGVIMLADGVWTSAEYDQILGRAVRKNSNLRIKDNGDIDKEKEIDPNTLIPNKIECISILLTARFKEPTNDIVKYSGDLRQFKIILTKRAITNQVIKQIEPYFYKIIDKSKSTKKKDEEGINEEYYNNDGIKKKSTRRNSKSRRRSTRRNSKSRRRSTRRKSKSRRTTRRKSKSRRTTRRRSKSKKRSTRRKSKSRRRY